MKRYRRISLFVLPLIAAVVFMSGWALVHAASPIEVGVAPVGQTAIEFVGRVDQEGDLVTSYGYVTYIYGVPSSALFSNPAAQDEHTAFVTFYVTGTLASRFVITTTTSSLFVTNWSSSPTYYFNATPGARFDDPASFARGVPVAVGTERFHDILNVQSPNMGIATGTGEYTQTAASPVTIGGQSFQLGRIGLRERFSITGEGTRTNPTLPSSFTIFAGDAVVTVLPGQ